MVRLTYVIEGPTPPQTQVQPVNLAFAAAAAARASWASKERGDNYWSVDGLYDDSPFGGAALNDGGLVNGSYLNAGARPSDAELQSSFPQRISGFGPVGGAAATGGPDAAGVHDIPRNSVLFRTHASQQAMTSSLPPAEPTPPSALQVAAILEVRKSRGMLSLPDDIVASAAVGGRGGPKRSASFSPSGDDPGPAALRAIAENGSGSGSNSVLVSGSRKASYMHPYDVGAATLGALSSSGGVGSGSGLSGEDRPAGLNPELEPDGEGEGGGEGERDGCLVLPVLHTLLAMQDENPSRLPPRHVPNPHGLSRMQSLNQSLNHSHSHVHFQALVHGQGHGQWQGQGHGHSYGGSALCRQPSLHALRASASSALMVNGGVGGGAPPRQGTLTANSSPARRRVGAGISTAAAAAAEAAAAAAANAKPVAAAVTLRRQGSMRPAMSYPAGYTAVGGGRMPRPSEDDDPLGLGAFEMAAHTASYTAVTAPTSPSMLHVTQGSSGTSRHTKRNSTALGLVQTPPPTASSGGGSDSRGSSLHGGAAAGPPPSPGARPTPPTRAATAKQLQPAPPQPTPQPAPGKSKSGRALFAWTHKIGKGKWPWLSSGGTAGINAGGGGGGAASSQELLPKSSRCPSPAHARLDTDGGGAAAAAARAPSPSALHGSGNGIRRSISGSGRVSFSGVPPAPYPPPSSAPQAAHTTGGPHVATQLPPIEHVRRRPTGGGGVGGGGSVSYVVATGAVPGFDPSSPLAGVRSGGAGPGAAIVHGVARR